MTALGRQEPVVFIKEFFRPVSCYALATGRIRPKAVIICLIAIRASRQNQVFKFWD